MPSTSQRSSHNDAEGSKAFDEDIDPQVLDQRPAQRAKPERTDSNADGSLRHAAVIQVSADGLLKTTSTDSTGLTNGGVPVYDTSPRAISENLAVIRKQGINTRSLGCSQSKMLQARRERQ